MSFAGRGRGRGRGRGGGRGGGSFARGDDQPINRPPELFPERELSVVAPCVQWEVESFELAATMSDLFQQSYNYLHSPVYGRAQWGKRDVRVQHEDLLATFEPVGGQFPSELLVDSAEMLSTKGRLRSGAEWTRRAAKLQQLEKESEGRTGVGDPMVLPMEEDGDAEDGPPIEDDEDDYMQGAQVDDDEGYSDEEDGEEEATF